MTDNEITREKTFSEELPYFKERIKEIFDNYDNPNGYEDPLYIAVLRDSYRIVRKAEEEIKRQQVEYNNLLEQFRVLDCECGRLEKADENQKAEIERLEKVLNGRDQLINALNKCYKEAKSEAYKEFAERLNDRIVNFPSVYPIENVTLAFLNGSAHRQLEILEIIDNLVKEMVGEVDE